MEMNKGEIRYYVTSESVTEGHPDRYCDQISDGILDEYLKQDSKSHVAVEAMVSTDTLVIAGEVASTAKVNIVEVARNIIRKIGYTTPNKGFDADSCLILTNVHNQSSDISIGVKKSKNEDKEEIGSGDQGIMYGYACDETKNFMPISCELANRLSFQLAKVRKIGGAYFLYPDGKTQVTMAYDSEDNPISIESIVISAQHSEKISNDLLREFIIGSVINPVIDNKWITKDTKIYINPTGRFVIGGPTGDTGLTGRKIMVDSYGTISRHGGGAFSGKDPTKVDRSGAYMARYVAKNIVAANLAKRCEVSIAYAIGGIEPLAVTVNTFNTGIIPDREIEEIVKEVFSFKVVDIIENLQLRRPQYLKTAAYGHFGRDDEDFAWEKTNKVDEIKRKIKNKLF